MANKFKIYFNSKANFDQITAVDKALKTIGPGPVETDYDEYFFTAKLNWGISGKDVANLKGRLNLAANIVTRIDVV